MKLIFFLLILSCKSVSEYEYISNTKDSRFKDFLKQSGENTYTNVVLKNGEFYLYKPCDLGYQQLISINVDKVTIQAGETIEYNIHDANNYNNITEYELYDSFGKGKLLMKSIDKDKTIFKLEYGNVITYYLMTPLSTAQNYTLIIHNCKEKKVEMTFDHLDLERMWNK